MKTILKPVRRRVEKLVPEGVGKALYGNLAGYRNNREGQRRLQNARQRCDIQPIDSRARELREQGCAFYPSINQDCLKRVQEKYYSQIDDSEAVMRTNADRYPAQTGEEFYRVVLKDTAGTIPEVIELIDADLQAYLRSYYGTHFSIHSIIAWRNLHVSEEVLAGHTPYSLTWHFDRHPTDTLKLFIALSDIGADSGPFHFVSSDRTKEILRKGYKSRHDYGSAAGIMEENALRMTGPAGTAAFCNTTTNLHRAGVPARGYIRDILQYRFVSSVRPYSPSDSLQETRVRCRSREAQPG